MKKTVFKTTAAALCFCLLLGAAPLSASALTATWQNIDVNTEVINYHVSPWTISVNKGLVWQNKSIITENATGGTVHRSISGARIERNYGRVGSDVDSSYLYGPAGNAGYIYENYGTVDYNDETGNIVHNYGTVRGDNLGVIMTNEPGSYTGGNGGTIGYNIGRLAGNTARGTVYYNIDGGTIDYNYGYVETNKGTIECNGGGISLFDGFVAVVTDNEGTIKHNSCNCIVEHNTGTVTKNTAYVYNYGGTVTDNADDGVVYNYRGGTVENNTAEEGFVDNYEGGTVVNNKADGSVYDYGGTVVSNSGAHYHSVDFRMHDVVVRYGEGFNSHDGFNGWLREGGTGKVTLTPVGGLRLRDIHPGNGIISATEKENGSWELTVGGVDTNIDNHTFGLETYAVHTVTIDVGDFGEDITVTVPNGENFFMALYEAGVFNTLDAMETEDYLFRDICTKPLSEFADSDEMGEDAAALLNSHVDSDMTVYAVFFQKLRAVELNVAPPVAGTVVEGDWETQTNRPVVTLGENAHCYLYSPPVWETDEGVFEGVIQAGETYRTGCMLFPDFGYWLDDGTAVSVNGGDLEEVSGRMAIYAELSVRAVPASLRGDANGDGVVDIRDVTAIQRHLAKIDTLDGVRLNAADVNGDGVVTIDDATALQMYLAEFDVDHPIGQNV